MLLRLSVTTTACLQHRTTTPGRGGPQVPKVPTCSQKDSEAPPRHSLTVPSLLLSCLWTPQALSWELTPDPAPLRPSPPLSEALSSPVPCRGPGAAAESTSPWLQEQLLNSRPSGRSLPPLESPRSLVTTQQLPTSRPGLCPQDLGGSMSCPCAHCRLKVGRGTGSMKATRHPSGPCHAVLYSTWLRPTE